jgi:hypothetical protein
VRSAQRFCWTIYDSKPAIIPRLRPPPSTDAWASWSARCATSFLIRPAVRARVSPCLLAAFASGLRPSPCIAEPVARERTQTHRSAPVG